MNRLKTFSTGSSSSNLDSGLEKAFTTPTTIEEESDSDVQLNELGAPVEKNNPLGYNVGYLSLIYLVVQGVIGTGIFATPGTIISQIGSVGAAYVLWVVGFLIALLKVLVYIEYVTYFKNRSGGDVSYLEQAYPKPAFLIPTTYAAVTVVLSFSTSSAVAFGSYILQAAEVDSTTWRQRGIGTGVLTFCCLLGAFSTKWTLRMSNLLGHVKIITLLLIIISGFVCLAGGTNVTSPKANFSNSWDGTTTDANSIANAIIKISFSYGGTNYAFMVASELPEKKRLTGYKVVVPATFFTIFVVYILCVTAFVSGSGSLEQIKNSSVLVAAQFFENVFGSKGRNALCVLVALSAMGHLLAVVVSHSRSLRECGRQGVLPWKKFWVSTKPFGTPLGPMLVTFLVNLILLLAPPAGDAYNFIVDLGSYAMYIFDFLMSFGLILLRRQRKKNGLGFNGWKVPLPLIIIQILFQIFVLAMPLVPPDNEDGSLNGSDVSFFYATYCIVAFGLVGLCCLYYVVWQFVLPNIGGYRHRVERYELENGELGNRVICVPVDELAEWDAKHGKKTSLAVESYN